MLSRAILIDPKGRGTGVRRGLRDGRTTRGFCPTGLPVTHLPGPYHMRAHGGVVGYRLKYVLIYSRRSTLSISPFGTGSRRQHAVPKPKSNT